MRKLLIVLCVLLLFPGIGSAADLYVNSATGDDSNSRAAVIAGGGSVQWETLLRATLGRTDGNRNGAANGSEAAQAGDTVYVAAGTYEYDHVTYPYSSSQRPIYEPTNSGSAGNWIKIEAVGTVNLTTNNIPGSYWVSGDGAPIIGSYGTDRYVWFDGFTINQQTIRYRRGRGVVNIWGSHARISNCTIIGTYTNYGESDQHNGILLDGPAPCTIDSNNITIDNNTLTGFTGAFTENDTGMTMYCIGDDYLIEHNEVHGNGVGIRSKTAYLDSDNIVIRYNLMYDNDDTDLTMAANDSWRVYQNVFRDSARGFRFSCEAEFQGGDKPTNMRLVNNTFDNHTQAIYIEGTCSNASDNIFQNNIITNSTRGINSEVAGCFSTDNINANDIFFDYNMWEYSSIFWYYQDGDSTVEATLSSAQTNYDPVFANGMTGVDCLYTDESGNDFTLQAGSTCREGQTNDGVDILDLDGDLSTSDAITLGAYITGNEEIGLESGESTTTPSISGGVFSGVQFGGN